jgi:hypothetical protein
VVGVQHNWFVLNIQDSTVKIIKKKKKNMTGTDKVPVMKNRNSTEIKGTCINYKFTVVYTAFSTKFYSGPRFPRVL